MKKRVLIIGGYGNFGRFIARHLARGDDMTIIVAGRSGGKARAFADTIGCGWAEMDIARDPDQSLAEIRPDIVIHASGPFQGQGYDVARACIRLRCHYIDLADGRDFVARIGTLDGMAKDAGILVVSGASSVPCLTSAIIDRYKDAFGVLRHVDYGIATAQKTSRGQATAAAVLGYAGKPFSTLIDGKVKTIYGWQGLHARRFESLGWRLLGNCDIPDLALFPERYPALKTIRFYAGLELPAVHLALWLLTWGVRSGLIRSLAPAAPFFLRAAGLLDRLGSDRSAFYMRLSGADAAGRPLERVFTLTAGSGHGPYIPCMPSILMARRLADGRIGATGAYPCMGFIDLDSYLKALEEFDISWNMSAPL